jgi:hypothetical protein
MLRRLLIGLVLGLIVGALLAGGLIFGLKALSLQALSFDGTAGVALAYLASALVGVLTGLVAGKPIWASGAKIEAGLKAVVGALLGAGAMFALRQWCGSIALDLGILGPGAPAAIGSLPAASLPLIAAMLGALFELDNTAEPEDKKPPGRKRIATERANGAQNPSRVAADEGGSSRQEGEAAPKRTQR